MRGAAVLGGLLAMAGSGCDSSPPPARQDNAAEEKLLQDHRALRQEDLEVKTQLVALLAGIKDQTSMAAALPKVANLNRTVDDLSARQAMLGAPPPAIRQRLQEEFGARLVELLQSSEREAVRINALPGGPAFFQAIKHLPRAATP